MCFVCINRCSACASMPVVDVWYWCFSQSLRDLRHLMVTEYLPNASSYFCHTLGLLAGCSPEHWVRWRAETQRDVYRGHTWPGLVPGEHGSTTLILSVTQPVSQPVWGGGRKARGEWRHTLRGGGGRVNALRQVFPPVNHSPQNRSNDAGSLRRPAGVEPGEGGPNVTPATLLSIIIRDMMT